MEMREAIGTRWFRIPANLWRLIFNRITTRQRRLRETVEGCLQAASYLAPAWGESAGMPLAFAVERSFMVVRARLWNFGGVIGEGFRQNGLPTRRR